MRGGLTRTGVLLVVSALVVAGPGCSQRIAQGRPGPAVSATSVADYGGMDGLIAAARREGELNVVGLPPNWVNYGEILSTFSRRYGIKINSTSPEGSGQDEINAADRLQGRRSSPDVFDLGTTLAAANIWRFAHYQVSTWDDIPAALKDPEGAWVSDYGGYMSIGYNADRVPAPTSLNDLLHPAYRGAVALNGDPTRVNSALNGVVMATLALGGTPDDTSKGVDFFARMYRSGNFLKIDPNADMIEAGQVPVVIDWDYLNVATGAKMAGKARWHTIILPHALLASYYVQAINADAPHPAAARLWQEFVYSDQGQNLWLRGGVRPVRLEAMRAAGTIDRDAYESLPPATGTPVVLTAKQSAAARDAIARGWRSAMND